MGTLLEVKNLKTHFVTRSGVVRAVDDVSWDVGESETVALVGESGCGKSVSALSIMRLVAGPAGRIVGGEVLFKGRDLLKLSDERNRLAFLDVPRHVVDGADDAAARRKLRAQIPHIEQGVGHGWRSVSRASVWSNQGPKPARAGV